MTQPPVEPGQSFAYEFIAARCRHVLFPSPLQHRRATGPRPRWRADRRGRGGARICSIADLVVAIKDWRLKARWLVRRVLDRQGRGARRHLRQCRDGERPAVRAASARRRTAGCGCACSISTSRASWCWRSTARKASSSRPTAIRCRQSRSRPGASARRCAPISPSACRRRSWCRAAERLGRQAGTAGADRADRNRAVGHRRDAAAGGQPCAGARPQDCRHV